MAHGFSARHRPFTNHPPSTAFSLVKGDDGNLYDVFWNGNQWQWENQGRPLGHSNIFVNSAPSAVYQSSALDRVTCFVIGSDGHVYDVFWNGTKWQWEDQGSPSAGVLAQFSPSAVYQRSLDRITCFVIGSDGHLYDVFWTGTKWQWETRGTFSPRSSVTWISSPSAVWQSSALDRITCFVIGSDGHLYDVFWNGESWQWEAQGAPG